MRTRTLAAVAATTLALPMASAAETLYGLTAGNSLARFDSASPGTTTTMIISGLQAGESLLGIDFRPANMQLYGLGSSNRLYVINPTTAVTSLAGTGPGNDPFGPPSLSGTAFGFDFNPVPDRIRVTGNTGQNLRLNPNTGAIAGTDTEIDPLASIVGSAYDRNDIDPSTSTTLFVIDSGTNALYRQGGVNGTPSPNGGALTLIGALGIDTDDFVGFDISGPSGIAYATLTAPGTFSSALYRLDLGTGAASLIGSTGLLLRGLTAAPVPLPPAVALLAPALIGLARLRCRQA